MIDPPIIAIDGPAGAGKSSVARAVASRLGYLFLDTGAMYRALTWKVLQEEIAWDDELAIAILGQQTRIALEPDRVLVDGFDVTQPIRHPDVTRHVSLLARIAQVREVLVEQQRAIAASQTRGVVAEGRDMGTTVFPAAPLKIYLVASPLERAKRRQRDLQQFHDLQVDLDQLVTDIQRRDEMDSSRTISPLRPAPDAIFIDSDPLSQQEVIEKIITLCNARGFTPPSQG